MDLAELAHETEGFSGADLQALVYNAHLEVIHDTISAFHPSEGSTTVGTAAGTEGTEPVKYTVLGGQSGDRRVLSRAEESAFQRRVRTHSICFPACGE